MYLVVYSALIGVFPRVLRCSLASKANRWRELFWVKFLISQLRGPARGGGGGPRSLVGILKCLVSAFCQRFTSLSEIERHTFVLVVTWIKWQTALRAIFSPPTGAHNGGLLFFLRLLIFLPFFFTSFLTFLFNESYSSRSLIYLDFIWALSLLFGPCRLSEFTLAGPQLSFWTRPTECPIYLETTEHKMEARSIFVVNLIAF